MTPKHGKPPAILYTKNYSTASGAKPLPSPSGVAVERGAVPARPTEVDSQGEGRRGREEGEKKTPLFTYKLSHPTSIIISVFMIFYLCTSTKNTGFSRNYIYAYIL
jgi:hypothetical protein